MKFGKDITSRKGRVPPRIYGYDRLDNFTLRIVPAEAEVVREIFRLYLQGLGCRKIAQALEERGASTKLGASWNSRGVRRVLENPIYCGHYVNHKYTVSRLPLRPDPASPSGHALPPRQAGVGHRLP